MKRGKKRSKSVSNLHFTRVLSLGHYNIDYAITLDDDDMREFNLTDVTKLKTYDDIKFIVENINLWNKIRITTENNFLNLLLYMNKINIESNKIYIEFISYEQPIYFNDEVKEMFQAVNDLNYIFVNETALYPSVKKNFTLTIRFRDRYTVIDFGEFEDNRNLNVDNDIMEEGVTKVQQVVQSEDNEEEPKNVEQSIFDRIPLACDSYNYFISSIGETLETSPYEDFVEFVVDAKLKYGALIVTEYGDHIDYFSDKETMTLLNKLYLITDIFLFDAKEVLSNFKKHYEILTKENSKKVYKFGEIQINNYPFGTVDSKRNENEPNYENNNSNISENNEENQEHKEEIERTEEEKEETNREKENKDEIQVRSKKKIKV